MITIRNEHPLLIIHCESLGAQKSMGLKNNGYLELTFRVIFIKNDKKNGNDFRGSNV